MPQAPFLALLFAPFVGSFLGVVVDRLPAGRPIAWDRSRCDHCGHVLGPASLIPIISHLLSRGRCRHCGDAITPMYALLELAAFAPPLSTLALRGGDPADMLGGCLLGWTLLALALIDARHLLLPDRLTLPLLACGLVWNAAQGGAWGQGGPLWDAALAAGIGYGALVLVERAYKALRGRDGLGRGDAKLLAAGGAWLGTAALGPIIVVAALTGLAAAAVLHLRGRRMGAGSALPFGPFLAMGIWACWLLGG